MKIPRSEKRWLGSIGAVTYASGAALLILSRWIRVPSAVGEQHHPAEFWVRLFHSLLTYAVILGVGYLVKGHVVPGLRVRSRRGAVSGFAVLLLVAVLVGTAVTLLYAGEADWVNAVSWVHAGVGLSVPSLVMLHAWFLPSRTRVTAGRAHPLR